MAGNRPDVPSSPLIRPGRADSAMAAPPADVHPGGERQGASSLRWVGCRPGSGRGEVDENPTRSTSLTNDGFGLLMHRLRKAGFGKEFVSRAILPDWWDDSCAHDPSLLPEVELRAARFLGVPLSSVSRPEVDLAPPPFGEARLRQIRDVDRQRLSPAIHSALRVADAVVRNLPADAEQSYVPLPSSGLEWRRSLLAGGAGTVTLDQILDDLWRRGVPVIPMDILPTPGFQGLAAVVRGRPVIVVGHRHDEPGRVAFLIGHEAGHVAAGDCTSNAPVVDQDEEILTDRDDPLESRADTYATELVAGDTSIPSLEADPAADFRTLAKGSIEVERSTGADAGAVLFAWARRTGDFARATMAVKALYRHRGARKELLDHFRRMVRPPAEMPESDRELLRVVTGDL